MFVLILRKRKAQTEEVVRVVWIAVGTMRHSAAPSVEVPAAATAHAARA